MGLDMYLEVRDYVSASTYKDVDGNFERVPVEAGASILQASGLNKIASPEGYGVTVSATAIYWRKVNSIHNWFVENVGGGVDECQSMYVPRATLEELRDTVEMVYKSKNEAVAQEHLPTASGFFFGQTDYNEYYWGDLEYTLKELNRVLNDAPEDVSFYYQASW
jgi:hypothetical protein